MVSVKLLVKSLILGLGFIVLAQQSIVFQNKNQQIEPTHTSRQKALSQSEYFYNREVLLNRLKTR